MSSEPALIAAGKVWAIDDEGGLGGVVVLEDLPDALQVENIAVRPERQGRGLGRHLLSFADDEEGRQAAHQSPLAAPASKVTSS